MLSGVYYFYNEPKAFSGGALRLYRFNAKPAEDPAADSHVDVQPLNNSLVAGSCREHQSIGWLGLVFGYFARLGLAAAQVLPQRRGESLLPRLVLRTHG